MTEKTIFRSPNEIQEAAKREMLDGRDPVTEEDWQLCANFWAAQIYTGLEEAATPLMGLMFDCPLSKSQLIKIARFQAKSKKGKLYNANL